MCDALLRVLVPCLAVLLLLSAAARRCCPEYNPALLGAASVCLAGIALFGAVSGAARAAAGISFRSGSGGGSGSGSSGNSARSRNFASSGIAARVLPFALFAAALLLAWPGVAPLPVSAPALFSVPLFALSGELAVASGIGDRILGLAALVTGHGLRVAGERTVLGCALFATVSGAGPMAVNTGTKRLFPQLLRAGYSRAAAAGAFAHRTPRSMTNAARQIVPRVAAGSAVLLILTAAGSILTAALAETGISARAAEFIFTFASGRVGAILLMNLLLLASGCVLHMPVIITFIVPPLFPLAALCGMSPAHFGVVAIMNIAIGLVTPPRAHNLAAAACAAGVPARSAARAAWLFFVATGACLAAVSFLPELSLWLPEFFGWPV